MNRLSSERRRYFRVTDNVGLYYELLDDVEDSYVDPSVARRKSEAARLEQQILLKIEQLKSTHNDVVPVLELLNRKINLSLSSNYFSDTAFIGHSGQSYIDVSLSACGIAFPSSQAIGVGESLKLGITLYPSNISLNISAMVVGCDELTLEDEHESDSDHSVHLIRADFTTLSEPDQEILVQHVVRRQSQLLKEQRESRGG